MDKREEKDEEGKREGVPCRKKKGKRRGKEETRLSVLQVRGSGSQPKGKDKESQATLIKGVGMNFEENEGKNKLKVDYEENQKV